MIVGTAGHIDHGKTALVRALTGVDTDRLPEEKARGISIELGYAFLDVPQQAQVIDSEVGNPGDRLGFIDVPGHERLVHTMLAGSTGIDFGLLVVAADDGVMPQTREHLAVLSLLGIGRGAVAITKIDRVDAARVDAVRDEVSALLAETPFAGAPVVPVSAQTGEGVGELRERLFDAARGTAVRATQGQVFRLAVDRVFTLGGVGTVVTGTVHAGVVHVGDEVALTPSLSQTRARVRSLHAQNQAVTQARGGQRCAVALVGVAKDDIGRGQWLVAADSVTSTVRLDAKLTLWHGEERALRSGTPVHVHIGAADVLGTVAILAGGDALLPGATAYVQLVLREGVGAWRGDRVVLRDASSSRTLAGGIVLDPFAPARYRRTPQRLAELDACSLATPRQRLAGLIEAAPFGVSLGRWLMSEGLNEDSLPPLPADTLRATDRATGDSALGKSHADATTESVLVALQQFHAREPDVIGPDSARLRRLAVPRLPEPLWRALLIRLQSAHRIDIRGAFVHLPEHGVRLSAVDQRLAQKLAPLLEAAGFEGSWARDLARATNESEALMRTTLARLGQGGSLHQVVKDLYYADSAIERLAALARCVAQGGGDEVDQAHADGRPGGITAARFRDVTGLGRKRAIQLLEYFDHIGLLRRVGDVHRLRTDTALFRDIASP